MPRICIVVFAFVLAPAMCAWATTAGTERVIPVVVTAAAEPKVIMEGDPIALQVNIANGLNGPVGYSTFSLSPTDWNGETISLTLVDIYRDEKPGGLLAERPRVDQPLEISGTAQHSIKPGEVLSVTTDARKWKIAGGWVPGKYQANVRVEHLSVEDGRCVVSVLSEPFVFEVR